MDLPQEIIYCDILNGDFSIFLIIYLFMWIHLQGRFVTPPHPLIYFYLYKYKLMDICFIFFFLVRPYTLALQDAPDLPLFPLPKPWNQPVYYRATLCKE